DIDVGTLAGDGQLAEQGRLEEVGGVDHGQAGGAQGEVRDLALRVGGRALQGDRLSHARQGQAGDHAGGERTIAEEVQALRDLGEVVDAAAGGVGLFRAGAEGELDVVGQAIAVGVGGGAGGENEVGGQVDADAGGRRGAVAVGDQAGDRIEDGDVVNLVRREE